jgi:hypothetical protein
LPGKNLTGRKENLFQNLAVKILQRQDDLGCFAPHTHQLTL